MRHIGKINIVILMVSLFLIACHKSHTQKVRNLSKHFKAATSADVHDNMRECTDDASCTLIEVNCCGCSESGKLTAIHVMHVDEVKKNREKSCANIVCAQMISKDPSCSAKRAVCRDSICQPDIN